MLEFHIRCLASQQCTECATPQLSLAKPQPYYLQSCCELVRFSISQFEESKYFLKLRGLFLHNHHHHHPTYMQRC